MRGFLFLDREKRLFFAYLSSKWSYEVKIWYIDLEATIDLSFRYSQLFRLFALPLIAPKCGCGGGSYVVSLLLAQPLTKQIQEAENWNSSVQGVFFEVVDFSTSLLTITKVWFGSAVKLEFRIQALIYVYRVFHLYSTSFIPQVEQHKLNSCIVGCLSKTLQRLCYRH